MPHKVTSYLLSIEMERLLERGVTVSLFSRVIVGSDEEEEKTEAGEVSFTESEGESGTMIRSFPPRRPSRFTNTYFTRLFSVKRLYLYLRSP